MDPGVYKKGTMLGFESKSFEMADEQSLLDNPIEVKGLPDVIPEKEYASTVLEKIEDDFMGMIMKGVIRECTNDILKREVTSITDEMLKFRKMIGNRMMVDESLDNGAPVQLKNLQRGFEAGWRMWRTAWDNREDEAYDAFISVMMAEEKPEEEKKED